jgi:hypothetical protein
VGGEELVLMGGELGLCSLRWRELIGVVERLSCNCQSLLLSGPWDKGIKGQLWRRLGFGCFGWRQGGGGIFTSFLMELLNVSLPNNLQRRPIVVE